MADVIVYRISLLTCTTNNIFLSSTFVALPFWDYPFLVQAGKKKKKPLQLCCFSNIYYHSNAKSLKQQQQQQQQGKKGGGGGEGEIYRPKAFLT